MSKKIDIGIQIDLEKLISSRLIIQASSGGGKSYAIRKTAEKLVDHVQVIIIDIEGEFVSLREKFDFALVGKQGEIPLNIRYAEVLAHKLLETNLSAIIDLSEMEVYQRRIFMKKFATALIESPKNLWHPCVVIIDEADFYAPQGKDSESTNAVINLSSRGRKRGICPIYATQRIAKLHKDATGDILNKIIGLTGQDIDQQRAGSELGFTSKEDIRGLRKLAPGEFFGFGPAISNEVVKFKVGKVLTTHMEAGHYKQAPSPTPNAIKKILGKLADIPEEAEKELNTKQQLQDEIKRLKGELRSNKVAVSPEHPKGADDKLKAQVSQLQAELKEERRFSGELKKGVDKINSVIGKAKDMLDIRIDVEPVKKVEGVPLPKDYAVIKNIKAVTPSGQELRITPSVNGNSGDMRMLKAAAMFYPNPISKTRMAAFARMSHTGGSFGTYLSKLRQAGYIVGEGNQFQITKEGLQAAGDVPPLPSDPQELISLWCGIMGENTGASRILRVLGDRYPNSMTRQELGEAASMSTAGGSFGTYLSYLRNRALITSQGQNIKASDELFL